MNLLFGYGYLGKRVAKLWQDEGATVSVVTRSNDRASELTQLGYHAIVADVTQPHTLGNLPKAETVLFTVGFDRTSDTTIADVYSGGMKNVLAALPASVKQFIYISTTGVFGPAGGNWVDENTPPNPQRDGGRASLAAEQQLASHPLGQRSAILRLGGLYGPGRIPYLDALRAGQPIAAPSQGWLNLIHVDDAARITLAADHWLAKQNPTTSPHIFCTTDGHPVVRRNYYREVAQRIAAPEPTFVDPDPASPAAARARSDKRVRNEKMSRTFNLPLAYPTYRKGLEAIL
ncbi:MAG: SDR family oxidoreductase [Planctomycetes bacterium]|nr:SDR family oxidoreductase [Planctomycetota bacterium]